MIRARRVAYQVAMIDTECWDVFACHFEAPKPRGLLDARGLVRWQDLATALDRALDSRARAAQANLEDSEARDRLAGVVAVNGALRSEIAFMLRINAELTARAAATRAERERKAA